MHVLLNSKLPTLYSCCGVRLIYGINKVALAKWEELKSHPIFKERLRIGQIELVNSSETKKDQVDDIQDEIVNIVDLKIPEAISLIENTHNKKLLQEFADLDPRKGVQKKISEKIEELDRQLEEMTIKEESED